MNFYVNSGGIVLYVDSERIFQGSANANTIRFVGAFASSVVVTVAFRLPNGRWTEPQLMSFASLLSGVQSADGTKFNVWEYLIPGTVTEYFGRVDVQFFVHGSVGETGAQIASALSSFEVETRRHRESSRSYGRVSDIFNTNSCRTFTIAGRGKSKRFGGAKKRGRSKRSRKRSSNEYHEYHQYGESRIQLRFGKRGTDADGVHGHGSVKAIKRKK